MLLILSEVAKNVRKERSLEIRERHAPLTPLPPVTRPFERLAVYVLGPLPNSNRGNQYLVVFSDYLTCWPEVYAVRNQEAITIANLIIDEIFPRHGAPEYLLSDHGSNFTSALVTELCRLATTQRLRSSSYRPQCDGLVERLNNIPLIQMLSMFTN
jgi:transposase InsO family protein